MKTERKIVEMVTVLRGKPTDESIMIASVHSTSPFSLKLFDMVINKNIYINSSDSFKSGDTVVVYKNGVSFYVLERVVKVS